MQEQLYWIYSFNIIVNSTLSFFTTVLAIEFLLPLFRIKNPRAQVICYILPFFKICLDLCRYQFSNWALLYGINPLLAETGTRQLLVMQNPLTGIQFSMQDGKTFSIADLMALSINPLWIRGFVSVAIIGSVIAMTLRLVQIFQEKQYVSRILQASHLISLPYLDGSLAAWMGKKQITLAISTEVNSPCVIGKRILFPPSLVGNLSQEEMKAVIAHEIAHYYWRDSALRIACSFISSIFWWIPSRLWQRRIEEMQEEGSDAMIHRFGISQMALAEAVLKTAENTKETRALLVFSFAGHRASLKRRMQRILCEPSKQVKKWSVIQYGLLICCLLSVLFGKLWIF